MYTQSTAAKRAREAYGSNSVNTASGKKLLLMLYDGAIRNLYVAEEELENRDYTVVNEKLVRTQDIVTELMISVNPEAGEIARNLQELYGFLHRHLVEANLEKDTKRVVQARKILEELRKAWQEA